MLSVKTLSFHCGGSNRLDSCVSSGIDHRTTTAIPETVWISSPSSLPPSSRVACFANLNCVDDYRQEARLWKAGGKPGTGSSGSNPASANGSTQTTPEKTPPTSGSHDSKHDADVNGTSHRIAQMSLADVRSAPSFLPRSSFLGVYDLIDLKCVLSCVV